ncbi:RecX family transcriptional regulator [Asaia siamensis]|uniref:Regulatory protein RecX n=1 Tax=Asaia siamensis TaxID=110479 RepID=A0ABQ1M576_9PROT|nr:RecX family transcriptional regulator [Asaia siamensis]GBR06198.1 recombinase A [Asaia siamensis NRIC 0323]GGC34901.1 recombinase RecX [Asaia siamensis]
MSAIPDLPPPPTAATLRETALRHLARFAATEQGLAQVLERAVMRWARKAGTQGCDNDQIEGLARESRSAIAGIVADMRRLGALDDAAFARSRSLSLTRSGRSRRAVAASLTQKGIGAEVLGDALKEALGHRHDDSAHEHELGAALVLARKRRLGPFRRGDEEEGDEQAPLRHQRALAVFARAGFGRDVAERALALDLMEAEDRVMALKSS